MPLSSRKIASGLRLSILEGTFAQVHINLTAGMFLTSYALYLGLNDLGIGLLSAIPAFFTGFAFFSVYIVRILGSRRRLCVLFSGLGRGLFLVFAVSLLLDVRMHHVLFFVLIAGHNALMSIAGNAWQSWMSELVPREKRGSYFGIRNTVLNLVGLLATTVGGKILDLYKMRATIDHGLGLLFSTAAVSSTTAAAILSKQPEPRTPIAAPRITTFVKAPLRDTNFRRLLTFIAFWYLLAGVASPFYIVHMITNLKMSYSQIAYYTIIAGIVGMLCHLLWGKVIDRFKSKPVLTVNFFGAAFLPLLWLFASPDYFVPLWIDALLTGVFWSGINLGLFNIVFSLTDEKNAKEAYFALFTTLSGLCAFFASLLGGLIAQILNTVTVHIATIHLVNYHFLFIFSSCARFVSLVFLAGIREKEAKPTIYTLQFMGDFALKRLILYKDIMLNTFGIQGKATPGNGNP
jgi:MFS family permease